MNYLERSLERSGELWRAQEEALSRSLASAYVCASATEEDAAQNAASGAARQVPLPRGEAADESGEGAESDGAGGVGDAAGERIRVADAAARAGGAELSETEAYRRRLAEKLLGGAAETPERLRFGAYRRSRRRRLRRLRKEAARRGLPARCRSATFRDLPPPGRQAALPCARSCARRRTLRRSRADWSAMRGATTAASYFIKRRQMR